MLSSGDARVCTIEATFQVKNVMCETKLGAVPSKRPDQFQKVSYDTRYFKNWMDAAEQVGPNPIYAAIEGRIQLAFGFIG